jgi:hypothetical protein
MFCHRTYAPCTSATVRCHTRRGSVLKHTRLRLSGRYRTQPGTRRVCAVTSSRDATFTSPAFGRRIGLLVRTGAVAAGKGPAHGAFQCIAMFIERRSLGSGRQQLPVLRHDHSINLVNDSIRRDHIRPLNMGPIDLYLRTRYHRSQRAALQCHHVA